MILKRSHDNQQNDTQHNIYLQRTISITALTTCMLSVIILSIVMLSVLILNAVVPLKRS
jgi:hypothetical protein